jgi:hypothetical protein
MHSVTAIAGRFFGWEGGRLFLTIQMEVFHR